MVTENSTRNHKKLSSAAYLVNGWVWFNADITESVQKEVWTKCFCKSRQWISEIFPVPKRSCDFFHHLIASNRPWISNLALSLSPFLSCLHYYLNPPNMHTSKCLPNSAICEALKQTNLNWTFSYVIGRTDKRNLLSPQSVNPAEQQTTRT